MTSNEPGNERRQMRRDGPTRRAVMAGAAAGAFACCGLPGTSAGPAPRGDDRAAGPDLPAAGMHRVVIDGRPVTFAGLAVVAPGATVAHPA